MSSPKLCSLAGKVAQTSAVHHVKFQIDLGTPAGRTSKRDADQPLRVLVVGNFSGNAPTESAAPFTARRLDLDGFDAVMAASSPRLDLAISGLGESRVRLGFSSLDDFHPDAIFRECAIFAALREKRSLLANPATFAATAAGMLESGKAARPLSSSEGEMFARLLGTSGRPAAVAPATQSGVIQGLINRVVAPHIVADIAPEQGRYIASVDAAIAALMRSILHAPEFQALESAWRGARALLDETEGGEEVELWVADAGIDALSADLARSTDDPTQSATYELFVARNERAADAQAWSIVIGNYLFGPGERDLQVLSALGSSSRRAGAILIAGADSSLAGCESFAQPAPAPRDASKAGADRWRALRAQPFASSVALAAPRTLARLPYGKAFDAIDSFAFEELDDAAAHESFLWGNSAFALGRLLIQGFVARGWDMEPGDELELAELPAVVRGRGDDRALQACAEAYLGERGGEHLLDLGLVPVLSHERRAAVRLMRVQSIAEPAASLASAWT
jgi:type VI secretion system protein ImpC